MDSTVTFFIGYLAGKILDDNLPSFHYKNLWRMIKHGTVWLIIAIPFTIGYSLLRLRGLKKTEALWAMFFFFMAIAVALILKQHQRKGGDSDKTSES